MRDYQKNVQIYHKSSVLDNSLIKKQKINEQLEKMRDELGPLNSAKSSTCSLNETNKTLTRRSLKMQTNKFSTSFVNKNKLGLRKVLEQQKVKNIVRNFRNKLKHNLINSQPIEYQPFEKIEDEGFWSQQGHKFPQQLDVLLSVVSIFLILIICFIYPLDIVFINFMQDGQIFYVQTICVLFYLFQIGTNFLTIKNVDGRKLTSRRQIFFHYFRSKFVIDFLCLIILFIDMICTTPATRYLRLCVLFKVKECFQKLQKIQNFFINNFYKEQYWALAKVFLVNFAFAHCLATLLISMSNLSPQNNWLIKLQANNSPWYQQYIWAYYWGCTIMLTVGFGDINATNYKEALCITLIETFSCILLAYNINCVGNLINNIRQQDIEKNKNFKIMRRLAQQNNITEQLQTKVNNYIDESDKMKKKFGFEAEKNFICHLPQQLKADFLKQSNIKIFENLHFFSNFTEKTLLTLAEFIEVKIAHPQEIILKIDNKLEFIILKEGQVGYCTKRNGFQFNGTVIDLIKVSKKEDHPVILDLNFLRFQPSQTKFQVKSIKYAMIYKIPLQDLIQTLKNSILDFQSFCQSRQKSRHIIDEYEVVKCPYCPTKHSKMRCPKLHYIPLKQIVVYKYLEQVKNGVNQRKKIQRFSTLQKYSIPLKLRKHFKKLQQQIYKGIQTKSFYKIKKQTQKQHENTEEPLNKTIFNTYRDWTVEGKLSYQETRLTSKLQKAILEKVNKIFVEVQVGVKNVFWEFETDSVQNFKFYFPSFNASELNLQLNFSKQGLYNSNAKVLTAIKTMKGSKIIY